MLCCVLIKYIHLRGLGFVLPIEELWQGSALNSVNTGGKHILHFESRHTYFFELGVYEIKDVFPSFPNLL